jgi:SPP1 family predicted phage head-tail adaptor
VEIGPLNRRVTIKYLSSGQDAIGQPVTTWNDLAPVWASILHLNGIEAIKADAQASIVKASIKIRRRTDVTASMRVYHGSVVYEIKAVLPDEVDRTKTFLSCELINGGA